VSNLDRKLFNMTSECLCHYCCL